MTATQRVVPGKEVAEKLAPIISDGLQASGKVDDGKLIPIIVIDKIKRPDIAEMIRIHSDSPPGDVVIRWGKNIFGSKFVFLIVNFSRPIEIEMILKFDLDKNAGLVDKIIAANGFLLQAGEDGERPSDLIGKGKVIIDVPKTGFENEWEDILTKSLRKRFKKSGLAKKKINEAVVEFLKEWRSLDALRFKEGE